MKAAALVAAFAVLASTGALAAKRYEAGGEFNKCIQESGLRDGGVRITNGCGERLYITWRDPMAGMEAMDLMPGRSWTLNHPPVGGYAVCRFGFSPVDARDQSWPGRGQFRCVSY